MITWIKEKATDLLSFCEIAITMIGFFILIGALFAIILGVPAYIFVWICEQLSKIF